MSEFKEDTIQCLAALLDAKDEIHTLEAFLEQQHPGEYQRFGELRSSLPELERKVKDALRNEESGTFAGYYFKITRKEKTITDDAEILHMAIERGELTALLEKGFVRYAVNPVQLDRLPGPLRAVYGAFVRKEEMTPAVTLPAGL